MPYAEEMEPQRRMPTVTGTNLIRITEPHPPRFTRHLPLTGEGSGVTGIEKLWFIWILSSSSNPKAFPWEGKVDRRRRDG